jgi:hypothetical protein
MTSNIWNFTIRSLVVGGTIIGLYYGSNIGLVLARAPSWRALPSIFWLGSAACVFGTVNLIKTGIEYEVFLAECDAQDAAFKEEMERWKKKKEHRDDTL